MAALQPTPAVVVCLLSVLKHTPFFGFKQGGPSRRAPHPILLTMRRHGAKNNTVEIVITPSVEGTSGSLSPCGRGLGRGAWGVGSTGVSPSSAAARHLLPGGEGWPKAG